MKQLIKDVLDDMSTGQINLSSNGARELIATTITAALKTKGSYKEYTEYELDEQEARASWVCDICGENTFEVDSDYIGSGTNHLGCELELNIKMKHSDDPREHPINTYFTVGVKDKRETNDRRKSNRREKNWSQKKHEDKVFGNDEHREYPYNSFVRNKEEVDKLAEEIVSDNDTGYIYESPDGGKTVYKRKEGSDKRELVKDWKKINVRT